MLASLKFYLLLFFSLLTLHLRGQSIIPLFDNINVDQGLSQSSVFSIYQDSKGYMWFGTADGINRYDGNETKSYKLQDRLNKHNTNMFIRGKLVEDRFANIWFANETGIFYYQRSSDSVKLALSFEHSPYINMWPGVIHLDKHNNLWLAETYKGLLSYNLSTKKLKHYPYLLRDIEKTIKINRLFFAAQNDDFFWFSRDKAEGIFRFDTKTQKLEEFFRGKSYVAIAFHQQNIYLAQANAIDIYDTNFKFLQQIKLPQKQVVKSFISSMLVDRQGRLWVAVFQGGIYCYDFRSKHLQHYKKEQAAQSLTSNLVTTLYLDRSNNLWTGTDGSGVCRLNTEPPLFNSFPISNKLAINNDNFFTKCFFVDEDEQVWFGTNNSGFGIYNKRTGTLKMIGENSFDYVSSIFKDSRANVWIGYTGGLAIYNEKKGSFKRIYYTTQTKQSSPNSYFVSKIIELDEGKILAATKIGLILFSPTTDDNFIGRNLNLPIEAGYAIRDIVLYNAKEILLSLDNNGLYQIKLENSKVTLLNTFLQSYKINSIHPDLQNRNLIWVGSDKGLVGINLNNRTERLYNENQGLKNSYIYGVLEDKAQNLWLSTNGGLSVFNKKKQSFTNYTKENGLQSNEFNTGAYYQSASGQLYFGGIEGFNWFTPAKVLEKQRLKAPSVAITSLIINDSEYMALPDGTIKLPYWKNQLNFQFAVLDYTLPMANYIKYQLLGADNKVITSKQKNIRFHNLNPGHYTLRLWGINGYQSSSKALELNIIINPPFWRTWLFYSLLVLGFAILVVVLTRRISFLKLKKRIIELEHEQLIEKERQRIAREMHDDIAAGLTQINAISRSAAGKTTAAEKPDLQKITDTSRQLIASMGEIIWNLNQTHSFSEFIDELKERIEKTLAHQPIQYHLTLPTSNDLKFNIKPDYQRNLVLITQEILHNAIKHSKASNINIHISIKDKKIYFAIDDDGIGCNFNQTYQGNGLKNIQYRIAQMNGKIKYNSGKNGGCNFVYSVELQVEQHH